MPSAVLAGEIDVPELELMPPNLPEPYEQSDGSWVVPPATSADLALFVARCVEREAVIDAVVAQYETALAAQRRRSAALDKQLQQTPQDAWLWWEVALAVGGGVAGGAAVGLVFGFLAGVK